jgi:hypothetical protein
MIDIAFRLLVIRPLRYGARLAVIAATLWAIAPRKMNACSFGVSREQLEEMRLARLAQESADASQKWQTPVTRMHVTQIDDYQYVVDRATWLGWIENVASESHKFGITPVFAYPTKDSMLLVGFRFFAVQSDSVPGQLGLQNGDLVTMINGIDVSDRELEQQIWPTVREADSASITFERAQSTIAITVTIEP